MRIAISCKPKSGPGGGGNSFVDNLVSFLEFKNHSVTYNLERPDLDIILILDPRWDHPNSNFNGRQVLGFLKKNKNVLIVHRINECDERKNSKFMNKKLRSINYISDSTIYVGSWLKNLDLRAPNSNKCFDEVILNGSNSAIFNNASFVPWDGLHPLKLVTHHWSSNRMKGFDIYQKIDDLLSKESWRKKFQFSYIGNIPKRFSFKNSTHIPPLSGLELAKEISRHHGYITASINEPGGNHQNEGALCGLPLLYRDSGCMPEYCNGYGLSFNETNIEVKLIEFFEKYNSLVKVMPSYPHTSSSMAKKYVDHFEYLLRNRDKIVSQRNLKKNRFSLYRLYFPI